VKEFAALIIVGEIYRIRGVRPAAQTSWSVFCRCSSWRRQSDLHEALRIELVMVPIKKA